jgi:hypothetical protein
MGAAVKIKIPRRLITWWWRAEEWLNEPFLHHRFLRVDALVILAGAANVGWWYYLAGPWGAMYGLGIYVLVVMFALWFA